MNEPLEEPLMPVPKDGKELSREMMLGNQPTSNKKLGMSKKEILDTMTHLHLANKKIFTLNIKAGKLAYYQRDEEKPLLAVMSPGLQVLFLQENYLTTLGSCFMGLKHLVQINLFGNYITKMDCFAECTKLKRLYLENNRINRLEGLQNC